MRTELSAKQIEKVNSGHAVDEKNGYYFLSMITMDLSAHSSKSTLSMLNGHEN